MNKLHHEVRTAVQAWYRAGMAVVPVRADGSKCPAVPWKEYTRTRPTWEQTCRWYRGDQHGLGLICGAVSGEQATGLELLEVEGRAIADGARDRLLPAIRQAGLLDTWHRVITYAEISPAGGWHALYQVTGGPVPGNMKVASRFARSDELTEQERQVLAQHPGKQFLRVLAETRGEGGFVVVAPSGGPTHPTGRPWVLGRNAQPGVVATLDRAERDAIVALFAEVLDERPRAPAPAPRQRRVPGPAIAGERPGDAWARQTDWADILEPHGWTRAFQRGQQTFWRRPGKDHGWSARTGGEHDTLFCWSTSTEFPSEESVTKLHAYAIFNHRGDDRAAAAELRRLGYGDPLPDLPGDDVWATATRTRPIRRAA